VLEYFDQVMKDSKSALEEILRLPFEARVVPANEDVLLKSNMKITELRKKLPVFYTEDGKWILIGDLLTKTYHDPNEARSQLARCLLYAAIAQQGINHTGVNSKNVSLGSPHFYGANIYATRLAGIFLQEDLDYLKFPASDLEMIDALPEEKEAALSCYALADRVYLESRNPPINSVLLYMICDTPNQSKRVQEISSSSYKAMLLRSALIKQCTLHKNPKAIQVDLKNQMDEILSDIDHRKIRWRNLKPKLRKAGVIISSLETGREYADKLFKFVDGNVIPRNKVVAESSAYEIDLSELLSEIDEKFVPSIAEMRPMTEEERIGWIEFPDLIRF